MKNKNRKVICPGYYRDRKEGHIYYVFVGGSTTGEPPWLPRKNNLFLLSQIISYDETRKIAKPEKILQYIPLEVFYHRLNDGGVPLQIYLKEGPLSLA